MTVAEVFNKDKEDNCIDSQHFEDLFASLTEDIRNSIVGTIQLWATKIWTLKLKKLSTLRKKRRPQGACDCVAAVFLLLRRVESR